MTRSRRRQRQRQRSRVEAAAVPAADRSAPRRAVIEPAAGSTEPEPWTQRGLAILLVLVVALQALAAVALYFSDRRGTYLEDLLVVPLQPLPLAFFLCFLIAMPLAQRVARQRRPMRFVENLSVGAVALLLIFAIGLPASRLTVGAHYRVQLAALAVAEAVAYVATAAVYPSIYRRFWMPRRRGGRR